MGNRSRARGIEYEQRIVRELKELGFDVSSTRNASKVEDDNKIDIHDNRGDLPIKIQLKRQIPYPQYFTIRSQSTVDPKDFCLIWNKQVKKNKNFCSEGECVIMDKELFYDLIKTKYGKGE